MISMFVKLSVDLRRSRIPFHNFLLNALCINTLDTAPHDMRNIYFISKLSIFYRRRRPRGEEKEATRKWRLHHGSSW